MQAKNIVNPFTCNTHPSEYIQRVCLVPYAQNSLRCVECILNDKTEYSKDSLLSVNDFIDHVIRVHEKKNKALVLGTSAPNHLVEFLSEEETSLQRLAAYIEHEKQRVEEFFQTLLRDFTFLCNSKKNEIQDQLDKQLNILKINLSYYKGKVNKYFTQDKDSEEHLNREDFVRKINECKDTNQFEVLVKDIKDDISEISHLQNPFKRQQIHESLNYLGNELKNQMNAFPKSKFFNLEAVDDEIKKAMDVLQPLISNLTQIKDSFAELSISAPTIESKILRKGEDIELLKKWISPEGDLVRINLLYQGTRDGIKNESFHKLCDDHKNTLTVLKTAKGKVCGGFSDTPWNDTLNGQGFPYKSSNNAWLFSLDNYEKYPIKKGQEQFAICTGNSLGPTFGAGNDLSIVFSAEYSVFGSVGQEWVTGSSNFGRSYGYEQEKAEENNSLFGTTQVSSSLFGNLSNETNPFGNLSNETNPFGNLSNETNLFGSFQGPGSLFSNIPNGDNLSGLFQISSPLTGDCSFAVEELEVFEVIIYNSIPINQRSREFNSNIINLKEDLPLLCDWIKKDRKVTLELLYRGSRDGFSAYNFHSKCDNQGPTLVVCKSYLDRIFGGFTSKSWTSTTSFILDPEAFLFSLSKKTKHPIINEESAIWSCGELGPVFGKGYDLFICSDSDSIWDSHCNIGITYQADMISEKSNEWLTYLGGDSPFTLTEIEVFKVIIQ